MVFAWALLRFHSAEHFLILSGQCANKTYIMSCEVETTLDNLNVLSAAYIVCEDHV